MIEIGQKIDDRYRITSRIAHGGMADVYEAYDIVSRRSVAIKVMRVDMMDNPKNVERFKRRRGLAQQPQYRQSLWPRRRRWPALYGQRIRRWPHFARQAQRRERP
jgi:hypothetical protein